MPSAEQQNMVRRAQKSKQRANAKAKAAHQKTQQQPKNDGIIVTGRINWASVCRSPEVQKWGGVTKNNLVRMMQEGRLEVILDDDTPGIGGLCVIPTPAGFKSVDGSDLPYTIQTIICTPLPPLQLKFHYREDRKTNKKVMFLY